jgi:hypothetical protein
MGVSDVYYSRQSSSVSRAVGRAIGTALDQIPTRKSFQFVKLRAV